MLEARNITVSLGGRRVLDGIDLVARPGRITAIVGPNGSGKTTLLRALTADVPHSGTVSLNGRDTATARPWELAAIRAVLPQASALAFPFTVIEVVRMGLRSGTSGGREDIAAAALARVGLAEHAHRFFQELSGGEQQRAQLARVLAQVWHPRAHGAPCWLFLDEPVSSLDIGHQIEVMSIARDYAAAGGGVVAVMHDLNLTALFAEKIAVLSEGRMLAFGSPSEVMTDAVLSHAYGCRLRVNTRPDKGVPFLLPHAAAGAGSIPEAAE
ncbi:heme ABC transporter ATP-binding protein [Anianabacter salinae]|uniref:heme ABC transporter ATP-binding protein n=1 Tax=Anianabacter salinae TaxID=2851023 RepID=UPI00225E54A5|nr:heme ABC transporter ATP-binding protein [Anianabacter salinae]MBV0912468.1 heme ABC transporter ATP-binding protein [Anianabacter salinae]